MKNKYNQLLTPINNHKPSFPWLWIGTWSLGGESFGPTDLRESKAMLEKAIELGITHFDTANFYAHSTSEKLLGSVIKHCRKNLFISTKGGMVWKGKKVLHNATSKNLEDELYISLDNLNTNYIDLYQLHWPDPNVNIEESIYTLKKLKEKGLIRHWGIGNFSSEQVLNYIQPKQNIPHQIHFNPLHNANDALLAGKQNTRCINCIISPFEQGRLVNEPDHQLGNKDFRKRNKYFNSIQTLNWLNKFQNYSENKLISKASIILLWILSNKLVDIIIPGPRTKNQLSILLEHTEILKELNIKTKSDKNIDIINKYIGEELLIFLNSYY
jgi:aryl-alcohol dehydrogenase-like predicted oxidoreductase